MEEFIRNEIGKTLSAIEQIQNNPQFIENIAEIASVCVAALNNGKKIIFAGNGGSAADAQHLAAELVSRFYYNRPGLPAIAITTDTSALTAIGNDYGYDKVFSRQIEALANQGDILFAISTSGKSPNILKAIEAAKHKELTIVGMTGASGNEMEEKCNLIIKAPSSSTPKIQECHIMIGHIICALIEEEIFGAEFNPLRKNS